ncbi:hypothetical protein LTR56_003080 [Elasticomyces elasticus]|nr:hypothetical protein LTR56_003080 [Elasticomyces elasticus]KAK3662142.1 hypothetical protein LTR22_007115 [Elasticomyces elasticus]KAK4927496.1 hypothetical protein LTR49_005636 [Elasticomyces elasticus]KAK5749750.1 hypothetical protein LTS12_020178 [Elasticomyces elasticus]
MRSVEDCTDLLDADENLDSDSEADSDGVNDELKTAEYSRQLVLRNDQQVNEETIVALNELQEGERKFLAYAHSTLLQQYLDAKDENSEYSRFYASLAQNGRRLPKLVNEHLLLLQGLKQDVQQKIDRVTQSSGSTTHSSTTVLNNNLPRFAATLLDDFFKICRVPNEAEVIMLSAACDHRIDIANWCKPRYLMEQ